MFGGIVEKNILSEDQYKWLEFYLSNKIDTLDIISFSEQDMMEKKVIGQNNLIIEETLGRLRYQIPFHELRNDILETFYNIAHRFNSKLKLNSTTFAIYSNKYGKPKLPPHMDKHDSNFTMFYQVSSNIEWPLFIQQESETLQNNEALLLNTKNTIHWRYPRIFSDGEYTSMIFLHFEDGSKSMLTVQERYDICEPWKKIYNEIMIKEYGYQIH